MEIDDAIKGVAYVTLPADVLGRFLARLALHSGRATDHLVITDGVQAGRQIATAMSGFLDSIADFTPGQIEALTAVKVMTDVYDRALNGPGWCQQLVACEDCGALVPEGKLYELCEDFVCRACYHQAPEEDRTFNPETDTDTP